MFFHASSSLNQSVFVSVSKEWIFFQSCIWYMEIQTSWNVAGVWVEIWVRLEGEECAASIFCDMELRLWRVFGWIYMGHIKWLNSQSFSQIFFPIGKKLMWKLVGLLCKFHGRVSMLFWELPKNPKWSFPISLAYRLDHVEQIQAGMGKIFTGPSMPLPSSFIPHGISGSLPLPRCTVLVDIFRKLLEDGMKGNYPFLYEILLLLLKNGCVEHAYNFIFKLLPLLYEHNT